MDVKEKVSTYLSIICIEDKKKDKTYKFCNNDILNHNIFSSTILEIKHFFPFISDCLLQVLKILYQFWFVRIWQASTMFLDDLK